MQDDIKKAVEVMNSGGTILYPSDTIWGIGCDATNSRAVDKVYRMKFRTPQNTLIILASNMDMIRQYVDEIPEMAIELTQSIKDPLTIIYQKARNLARNIIDDDGSIAIRIPRDEFCLQMLNLLGKPITSTSANISGDPIPASFGRINPKIKTEVDYICTSNQSNITASKPSTIIKIQKDGQIDIVRN